MRIYILLDYQPSKEQIQNLLKMGFDEFIYPSNYVKRSWLSISPSMSELQRTRLAVKIVDEIRSQGIQFVWIEGDYGMVFNVVYNLIPFRIECIYSVSIKEPIGIAKPGEFTKEAYIYQHIAFSKYGNFYQDCYPDFYLDYTT